MKKNILFVINPISGGKNKQRVEPLILKHLDKKLFDIEFAYSNAVDHARKLSKSAAYLGFDYVVAVGGDGTVNEVAKGIASIGSSAAIGIIPFGSGNGLARYLNIPMNVTDAIKSINTAVVTTIDSVKFNDETFFNMAGMGFDAHISHLFAMDKKRGLQGYAKMVLNEVSTYQSSMYKITVDGKVHQEDALMISFANSTQFGNNFHIAPNANARDGILDITIVKKFPLYMFPFFSFKMITKSLKESKFIKMYKGKEILVERLQDGPAHIDGEPKLYGKNIVISVQPASLRVLSPVKK